MKVVPFSENIAKNSGSNFYWSFYFLNPERRRAILTIYAFSRLVDDAVDEAPDEATATRNVSLWRRRLEACYTLSSLENLPSELEHLLLPELRHTIETFDIPRSYFDDLITGVAMDIRQKRYATFADLEVYCYHVASTIGLLCNHLFGYREEAAYEYAILLGKAFQLTNITRDVGKDSEIGRIYLPQDEMKRFGVTEDDIFRKRETPAFRELMAFQAKRAEEFFQKSFSKLSEPKRRKIVPAAVMSAFYERILQKIQEEGYPVLKKKVSLSPWSKISLLAKTLMRAL